MVLAKGLELTTFVDCMCTDYHELSFDFETGVIGVTVKVMFTSCPQMLPRNLSATASLGKGKVGCCREQQYGEFKYWLYREVAVASVFLFIEVLLYSFPFYFIITKNHQQTLS